MTDALREKIKYMFSLMDEPNGWSSNVAKRKAKISDKAFRDACMNDQALYLEYLELKHKMSRLSDTSMVTYIEKLENEKKRAEIKLIRKNQQIEFAKSFLVTKVNDQKIISIEKPKEVESTPLLPKGSL